MYKQNNCFIFVFIFAETIERISLESRTFKDIELILQQSYKNVNDKDAFAYTSCYVINNEKLVKEVKFICAGNKLQHF